MQRDRERSNATKSPTSSYQVINSGSSIYSTNKGGLRCTYSTCASKGIWRALSFTESVGNGNLSSPHAHITTPSSRQPKNTSESVHHDHSTRCRRMEGMDLMNGIFIVMAVSCMDVSLSHTLCLSSIHALTHASCSSFLSLANCIKVCLHRVRPNHARADANFGYEHQNYFF